MKPQKRKDRQKTGPIPLSTKDNNQLFVFNKEPNVNCFYIEGEFSIHRHDIIDLPGGRIFQVYRSNRNILGTFSDLVAAVNFFEKQLKWART